MGAGSVACSPEVATRRAAPAATCRPALSARRHVTAEGQPGSSPSAGRGPAPSTRVVPRCHGDGDSRGRGQPAPVRHLESGAAVAVSGAPRVCARADLGLRERGYPHLPSAQSAPSGSGRWASGELFLGESGFRVCRVPPVPAPRPLGPCGHHSVQRGLGHMVEPGLSATSPDFGLCPTLL